MKVWGAQPPRLPFGAPSRRTRTQRKTRNGGLIPRAGCGAVTLPIPTAWIRITPGTLQTGTNIPLAAPPYFFPLTLNLR